MAEIVSPVQNFGNQRFFCSSVAYDSRYADTRSVCSTKPTPDAPMRIISSDMIALKRKSSMPPPPCSSGIMKPSRPSSPALVHSSRGTMLSFSHCAWCGAISFSQNVRTVSRNASWSASKISRFMSSSVSVGLYGDAVGDEAVDVGDAPGGERLGGVRPRLGGRGGQGGGGPGEPGRRGGLGDATFIQVRPAGGVVRVLCRLVHGDDGGDAGVGAVEQLGPLRLGLGRERLGEDLAELGPLGQVVAVGRVLEPEDRDEHLVEPRLEGAHRHPPAVRGLVDVVVGR